MDLRKLFSAKVEYKREEPKDSSLRSKVKPEPKWKAPNMKGFKYGKGTGY